MAQSSTGSRTTGMGCSSERQDCPTNTSSPTTSHQGLLAVGPGCSASTADSTAKDLPGFLIGGSWAPHCHHCVLREGVAGGPGEGSSSSGTFCPGQELNRNTQGGRLTAFPRIAPVFHKRWPMAATLSWRPTTEQRVDHESGRPTSTSQSAS